MATAQQIDRRAPSTELMALVQQIHSFQLALNSQQQAIDAKLSKHMTDETKELAEEIAKLMKEAFPEGDPEGHRKHHELVIRQAEARAQFTEKMVFELTRWGLFGFLGWAAYALWKAFLQGPMK